jgi:hypothetical protein
MQQRPTGLFDHLVGAAEKRECYAATLASYFPAQKTRAALNGKPSTAAMRLASALR